MTVTDKAYVSGLKDTFMAHGMSKQASDVMSRVMTRMSKKASLFNFGNSYDNGGFSWSSVLIPLIAAAGTGYVAYNAGATGDRNRSAYDNIKNYIGRNLSKVLRKKKSPSIFDFTSLSNH